MSDIHPSAVRRAHSVPPPRDKRVASPWTWLAVPAIAVLAGFAVLWTMRGSKIAEATPAPAAREQKLTLEPIQAEAPAARATAPNVPPPLGRNHAIRAIVDLEIKEHVKSLARGVQYVYWTFGDNAPGDFIRVRQGDLVEVRLRNHPDNSRAHSIDFQAAAGPGVGEASLVPPGHVATFSWRALRAGLFLYQCKASPPGLHVANGLYGLILVEPAGGLPPVDREYQIVQSEFYTQGKFGEAGPQPFSMDKAMNGEPEYVVFNGHVDALNGSKALTATVGESVRLFFANAGPNLVSSFHVSGAVFDTVTRSARGLPDQTDTATTLVPAGGTAMLQFDVTEPGDYTFLDHAMFRAFGRGTTGTLRVQGDSNHMIFSGRTTLAPYTAESTLPAIIGFGTAGKADGAKIYGSLCITCHQPGGKGLPKTIPPLQESDFLMADRERAIRILLSGLRGEIVVKGERYNGIMPNPNLDDEQIASVLSYVLSNFGNKGDPVSADEVAKLRASTDVTTPLIADPAWQKPRPIAKATP